MSKMRQIFAQLTASGLLAIGILSACTVVVEQPRPVSPQRPLACTFEYAPVCARRGQRMQTFANACVARANDFRVVGQGRCRVQAQSRPPQPAVCTREFVPVCAVRGNRSRTFNNACLARASGYRPIRRGRCG